MNANLNIKDLIINPKTLEIIAREMGEMDNGYNLIDILTSCGVDRALIEYPNTKWRMLYSVFCYLAKRGNLERNNILFKIIETAIHPLTHKGEKEISQKYSDKFNELLSFDDFYIKNNKIIKKTQPFTRRSSNNLNLYIKKKILLEKWRDDFQFPIIEFSFNNNTADEIFNSLLLIEEREIISFGFNNFPEDLYKEQNNDFLLNWETIKYMDENSEIVDNSYGIEIEIRKEDKLEKEIEDEISFFKNNKKKHTTNDIDIEWDTNNSYSYKKQIEIITHYLYKLHNKFENTNLLIILNKVKSLNIDVFRCLLSLEIEGFIKINGIKNNKDALSDNDDIYIKISLLKMDIFKNISIDKENGKKQENPNTHYPIKIEITNLPELKIKGLDNKKLVRDIKKINLNKKNIIFDDEKAKIIIDNKECQIPPYKNEHYFCRAIFQHPVNEFVDWSIIFENMDKIITSDNKKDAEKEKRSVQDTMYALNKRIKETINTEDDLFIWKEKSIKRNY